MAERSQARGIRATRQPRPLGTTTLGGLRIDRAPSALARRLQQICAASMAQCLAGDDLTPLQYAAFPLLRSDPGPKPFGGAGLPAR